MSPLGPIQPFSAALAPLSQTGPAASVRAPQPVTDAPPSFTLRPAAESAEAPDAFARLLDRMISEVNAKQVAAGETVRALFSGQNVPLHQAMIAVEEAGLSFQLMVEVRNRLLESYQELMRMQV